MKSAATDRPQRPEPESITRSSVRAFIVPAGIALYLNASLIIWGWLLLDIATGTFNSLHWSGITLPNDKEFVALLKLAFYAMIGGGIGGLVYSMQSLWKYTTQRHFRIVYSGDYIFRPFGSAALAVAVFALTRGGVLTALGAEPTSGVTSVASSFSAFAIGFLSGFGSYQVINKLDELIKQAFGKKKDAEEPTETLATQTAPASRSANDEIQ